MNIFETVKEVLPLNEDEQSKTKKLEALTEFLEAMDSPGVMELNSDNFEWINIILEDTSDTVKEDFFKLANSSGNTLIHEYFDYFMFWEIAQEYAMHMNFGIVGKLQLTPLELAVSTVNPDAVDYLLDAGASIHTFRKDELLLNSSFDGREFSDFADQANLSLSSYVKERINYIISRLEDRGKVISKEIKDEVANLEAGVYF